MQATTLERMAMENELKSSDPSAHQYIQIYGSDGLVMYWMKKVDEHRQAKKKMIFGIPYKYLTFMVRMFLAAHLESSKLIEDGRDGQPGDQVKLVPTSPNHPTRKFRIIQLWDNAAKVVSSEGISKDKTVLTPFIKRDERTSNHKRWLARRASPLKVDLVEEARKEEREFRKLLEEVRQYRMQSPEWEQDGDDGLDPRPEETIEAYCRRVKPRLHQKW